MQNNWKKPIETSLEVSVAYPLPKILEWEGSRCRRRREGWGVGIPILLGKGLGTGRGLCPSPENYSYFIVESTILWRFLTRLLLKSYANGRGSNLPNPHLSTPLRGLGPIWFTFCSDKVTTLHFPSSPATQPIIHTTNQAGVDSYSNSNSMT